TYDAAAHDWFPPVPAGEHTLASFSSALDEIELFDSAPRQHAWLDYRRWSLESAALDLALRQAGTALGEMLSREARPVRFVVSTRAADLEPLLGLYPGTRFKLDAMPTWTDDFVAALAARGVVDCVDLKGAYHGTVVDNP